LGINAAQLSLKKLGFESNSIQGFAKPQSPIFSLSCASISSYEPYVFSLLSHYAIHLP